MEEPAAVGTPKDHQGSAVSPTKRRSVSPNDPQFLGVESESCDEEAMSSLYRPDRSHQAARSPTSKARRSQSLDDVRDDLDEDDTGTVATGSGKIYFDDASENENGTSNDENFTSDGGEVDVRPGTSSGNVDDQRNAGTSDGGAQSVHVIPVVRARSFKEAMRSNEADDQPEYSRTVSHPAPSTVTAGSDRDSRTSWMMPPVFPSLEDIFNEWFTSAMARTGSLGSSSGTPCGRSESERSTSWSGRGVQMRRPSRNSVGAGMSPLDMPEFHNKRLTRIFDWEPRLLDSISGSSDSLDSAETAADDRTKPKDVFSTESRLPPGFETGLFSRDISLWPSRLPKMSQSFSDPHFSRQSFQSETRSGSGNGSFETGKVITARRESHQSQSGSTSRVIPITVITDRLASDGEGTYASSRPSADHPVEVGAAAESKTKNTAEDKRDSGTVSGHRTSPSSKHSSQAAQTNIQLPMGFLTGFGASSIPNVSGTNASGRPNADKHVAKMASVSETADDERNVRVIPVTHHERKAAVGDASAGRQRSTRGRVIPLVVQSSAANADARSFASPMSSRAAEAGIFTVPVTVMQSGGGTASNSAANVSGNPATGGNYLPLCYDDQEEDTVKKILQEMTIRRLPVRDTVRLLNMKKTRSMEFADPRRHGVREQSPARGGNLRSVLNSPTADLLPAGFWIGSSSGGSATRHSTTLSTAHSSVPDATGDLIRKRLHQFGGSDAN